MLYQNLLRPEVIAFIEEHLHADIADLILKGSPFKDISIQEIAHQVKGRQKARKKLPNWYRNAQVLFPPQLHLSQSSSETTALYKAGLVSGALLIDITGGLGIDSFYFSKKMDRVIHCEQNQSLSALAQHNFGVLSDRDNIDFRVGDGLQFLTELEETADWIYADPGRRSTSGTKVFRLEDTRPDILKHLNLLRAKSQQLLLKTSAFLDISQGLEKLKTVREVHVVSIKNEVKELLWIIGQKPVENPLVKTVDFSGAHSFYFEATQAEERRAQNSYSAPLSYLYEPNAAVMKAGFFKWTGQKFDLFKLAKNSHLYTGEKHIPFPGRCFKVLQTLPLHKKGFKKSGISRAHVSVRNFPLSVAQIRKKFNLKEGGEDYLFFTEDVTGKHLCLHTRKIANIPFKK